MEGLAWIHIHWLPLGAGGAPVVRLSGEAYERLAARRSHRDPHPLYHSALEVGLHDATWTIEMAPAWSCSDPRRGVVANGPVGSRLLGLSRWFQYEVRCWQDGPVPEAAYRTRGPVNVPTDSARVSHLLQLVNCVPTPVWGRDELCTGEMWNSNSLVAWLLSGSGHAIGMLRPPANGRAPGWDAGVRLAPSPARC